MANLSPLDCEEISPKKEGNLYTSVGVKTCQEWSEEDLWSNWFPKSYGLKESFCHTYPFLKGSSCLLLARGSSKNTWYLNFYLETVDFITLEFLLCERMEDKCKRNSFFFFIG